MPELPEVHTTATALDKTIVGLKIKDVWTDYNSSFHANKPNIKDPKFFKKFREATIDSKVESVTRRAKNILIHLSNDKTILIHMKMTGHLLCGRYEKKKEIWVTKERGPLEDPFNQYIHFVITFSNNKQLVLSDVRKFAKVTFLETEKDNFKKIGPEPLNLNNKEFKEVLITKPQGKIKQVLMNPHVIAGIGNIYSDEMLWRAGIHPLEQVQNVTEKQWQKLYLAMKHVLKKGIKFKGDSTSDYRNIDGRPGKFQAHHNAYKRKDDECDKKGCKGVIKKIKVGGRSAHFCPEHQELSSSGLKQLQQQQKH